MCLLMRCGGVPDYKYSLKWDIVCIALFTDIDQIILNLYVRYGRAPRCHHRLNIGPLTIEHTVANNTVYYVVTNEVMKISMAQERIWEFKTTSLLIETILGFILGPPLKIRFKKNRVQKHCTYFLGGWPPYCLPHQINIWKSLCSSLTVYTPDVIKKIEAGRLITIPNVMGVGEIFQYDLSTVLSR